MSNLRKSHLLGIGVLTPSLMGHLQTAEARSVAFTSTAQNGGAIGAVTPSAAAKSLLFRAVFTRTPAEKLRIAGDRIRLSEVKKNSALPNTPDVHIKSRSPNNARSDSTGEQATCYTAHTYGCDAKFQSKDSKKR
jgi:hypothetical protein